MQGKKRYLALVLFLLLGLITFSFANPDDQLEPVEGNVKKVSEQKDEKKVQTKFEKAEELVEQAEQNPTEEIIAEAEEAIEEAEQEEPELVEEEDLVNRLNNTEPAIDAAALISAVEKMIDEASKKDDVVAAKTYFDNNKVATVTDTLEDGTVKENLEERVAYLVKVFADTTNPVITGIENNQTTNIDVTLKIEDDIKVEKVVTLNGETIEYEDTFDKEGTYVVTVTDDAQNTTSITFTIDKTKPKFEGLSSREAHVDGYTVDITDATETTITVQKDHGDFAPITEGTAITEEGTYQLVAVDAAGNKYTTWVIVDRTEPSITNTVDGEYINQCTTVTIFDRYLNKVTINDDTYSRKDFSKNTKNENFKLEKEICEDGTYTITAIDKKGIPTTKTFTINKTKPTYTFYKEGSSLEKDEIQPKEIDGKFYFNQNVRVVFKEDTYFTQYIHNDFVNNENKTTITSWQREAKTDGEHTMKVTDAAGNVTEITIVVDTKAPTYKFYKEGSSLEKDEIQPIVIDGKLYFNQNVRVRFEEEASHFTQYVHNDFINNEDKTTIKTWTREAKTDGEHTMKVTDALGQATEVTFIIDTTPNRVTQTFYRGDNNVGKTYYVTDTDKVQFNIGFRELLSEDAVITIGGKPVALTYDKYYKATDSHMYYGYLAADENETILPAGELEISISNITDPVGNKGFYYQTNGKKVMDSYKNTVTTNGKKAVYDVVAPKANYVAILQKGDNYQYATNGDTIRFLVQFNEEIVIPENKEDRTFILTINGKEVKFQRSQGAGYEYIAEYKIHKDEANLAEGELTFSISGYKDAAGHMGEPITAAKHQKYYKVTYDKTPIWYDLYQPGVRPVKVVDTVELDGKLYIGEPAEVQFHDNYRIDSIQVNDEKPYVTPQGVSGQVKNITEPGEYTYTLIDGAGLVTKVTIVYVANTNYNVPNKDINLTEDVTLVNAPFYNIKENTQDIMINGNGHTVTQHVTSIDQFNWTENWTRTTMGNIFSNPAPYTTVPKITIKDIKFEGTTQSMLLGHYNKDYQGAKYFNTELNNVDMIGMNVVSLSANIAPTVYVYGNAAFNNVNIYDSKLSPLDTDPMWPVYDLGLGNYSKTIVKDSKIGSVITWTHSYVEFNNSEVDKIDTRAFHSSNKGETVIGKGTTVGRINVVPQSNYDTKYGYSLTIKKGATVKVLDISKITNMTYIVIEEGAVVEKVITAAGEMTYDEYIKQNTPITVDNLTEFKDAVKDGYKQIILTKTLDIEGKQTISAKNLAIVTTPEKITMFNVGKEGSLTLENIVLDGQNEYKVNASNAANTHNDPYNIFGTYPLEQTRIYENVPLITSSGTLQLGKGTVIKNYAHQPVQGTAKHQYGGPAILITDGSVTIDGLEFTNNVSQLLTAKKASVTIKDINVHDTWANGNKAGLIEINEEAKMTVKDGTFKNNMMSMRSYGLFIANSGVINMEGGTYENNYSTRNGGNTAGSLFGVENTGKIYMTGGIIQNNIGYRAGSFATRWAKPGSIIELNGGTIKNNTTLSADFKNAGIFVQSDVKIGESMIIEDKVVLRGSTAVLNNNGIIKADVELVDNSVTFNNNGSVTGNIIIP